MKHYILIALGLLLFSLHATAQKSEKLLFTGTIDGKIAITMFLFADEHPCEPKTIYQGIYKYDKTQGENKWLLLHIDYNEAKQFVMLEERFSGVMILRKEGSGFSGIWIHPDGTTQRKVVLQQKQVSKESLEKYMEELEDTNHFYHDC